MKVTRRQLRMLIAESLNEDSTEFKEKMKKKFSKFSADFSNAVDAAFEKVLKNKYKDYDISAIQNRKHPQMMPEIQIMNADRNPLNSETSTLILRKFNDIEAEFQNHLKEAGYDVKFSETAKNAEPGTMIIKVESV